MVSVPHHHHLVQGWGSSLRTLDPFGCAPVANGHPERGPVGGPDSVHGSRGGK